MQDGSTECYFIGTKNDADAAVLIRSFGSLHSVTLTMTCPGGGEIMSSHIHMFCPMHPVCICGSPRDIDWYRRTEHDMKCVCAHRGVCNSVGWHMCRS